MSVPAVVASTSRTCVSASGATSSTMWRLAAWSLIVVGVARLWVSVERAEYRNDFAHYYLSARVMLAGENPYTTSFEPLCRELNLEFDRRIPSGGNPPLLTIAVASVAWLPLPLAYCGWAVAQCAAFFVLLGAVRRVVGWDARDVRWLLLVGGILNTTCLQRQFHYSQVQVMVAACLAAAHVLHMRNRHGASCALAALAAAFKLYPAALLPWFLLSGLQGRRDFVRRSLAMAAVAVVVLTSTGVDAWQSFVVDGLPVIKRSVGGSLTNYSLPSLVSTLAGQLWGWPLSDDASQVVRLIGKTLAALALGGAYLIVWRRRLEPTAALGLLTAGMMAASLVCWSHYFVLMILPIAWLWVRQLEPGDARVAWPLLLAGTICLWPELDCRVPLSGGAPRMLLHFYPLAALAIVAALLVATLRGDRERPLEASSVG